MCERVPGGAVDGRDRIARGIVGRHERHAVRRIGVEVDPRDVPLLGTRHRRCKLVALEEEVRTVVVVGVVTLLVSQHEVGILVRLRFLRLRRRHGGEARHHLRPRGIVGAGRVVLVAVPADDPPRVFERHRSLRHHGLAELRRELRCRRVADGFRAGHRHARDRRSWRS